MTEKTFSTKSGTIHYWVNILDAKKTTLVFLPGLTADHRLFEKQIEYFENWKSLLKAGTKGVATTEYGRNLMHKIMMTYDGDKKRYAKISGHGFKILACAIEKDLPYEIKCPALLICGTKDKAGSCIRYSKAWHKNTNIPLEWIKEAGHNSNTDKPEIVNKLIEDFVMKIE